MRLKFYLNELSMKKDTKLKETLNGQQGYQVKITLEDGTVFFFAADFEPHGRGSTNAWEITFNDSNGRLDIAPKDKGIALQLFAALPEAVKMFLKAKKPEVFYFTSKADETSRVKLYNFLAKKVKGYKLSTPTLDGEKAYLFTKV